MAEVSRDPWNGASRAPAVELVDLFDKRRTGSKTSALVELALDQCEEKLMRRDWDGFGYWHRVYLRERQRLARTRG